MVDVLAGSVVISLDDLVVYSILELFVERPRVLQSVACVNRAFRHAAGVRFARTFLPNLPSAFEGARSAHRPPTYSF